MEKIVWPDWRFYSVVLLLCAIVAYLYWPTLQAELVWDDDVLVKRHHLLNIEDWFYNCFQRGFLSRQYYRPLPLLSLMLDGLWGEQYFPLLTHATNLFIFGLNLVMVMFLVWIISSYQWICVFIAGCIYALHPALLEAVSWMSGRCDLLVTFFILLALCLDAVLKRYSITRITAVCICFFCAALSKEMAATFPAVWLLWRFYLEDVRLVSWLGLRSWLARDGNGVMLIAIILTGFGYLFLRFGMLGYSATLDELATDPRDFGNNFNHFLLISKTFTWYLLLIIFPHYDLSAAYPTTFPITEKDIAAWIGVGALLMSAWVISYSKITPKIKYTLLVMAVLFLPIANIKPITAWDNFINLRFLTLPVTCAVIFSVPLLFEWALAFRQRLRMTVLVVVVLWCLSAIANLVVTVPLWSRDLYLWKWITETKSSSILAYENYALALFNVGLYQPCVDVEKKSLTIWGGKPRTYLTLALCYNGMLDRANASIYVMKALDLGDETARQHEIYSSLLGLVGLWEIEDSIKFPSTSSKKRQQDIVEILTKAIRENIYNENAPPLLFAWAVMIGDEPVAKDMAELMYLRKFPIAPIQKKISHFVSMTDEQKIQANEMLKTTYQQ